MPVFTERILFVLIKLVTYVTCEPMSQAGNAYKDHGVQLSEIPGFPETLRISQQY